MEIQLRNVFVRFHGALLRCCVIVLVLFVGHETARFSFTSVPRSAASFPVSMAKQHQQDMVSHVDIPATDRDLESCRLMPDPYTRMIGGTRQDPVDALGDNIRFLYPELSSNDWRMEQMINRHCPVPLRQMTAEDLHKHFHAVCTTAFYSRPLPYIWHQVGFFDELVRMDKLVAHYRWKRHNTLCRLLWCIKIFRSRRYNFELEGVNGAAYQEFCLNEEKAIRTKEDDIAELFLQCVQPDTKHPASWWERIVDNFSYFAAYISSAIIEA